MRLRRQLQGLLNRLSDANMESIVAGIEDVYRKNSRHDVTEIITDILIGFIGDHANLLDSFVMTYTGIITLLYNIIGLEFGAHFIQTTVELYNKSISEITSSTTTLEGQDSKRATNLVTLICYLYSFGVVACPIVYDLIRECIQRMTELDVEIILKILRVAGQTMRSDDPSALKDIVTLVNDAVMKDKVLSQKSRVKYMIETIMDLKNNKKKLQKKLSSSTNTASGASSDLQQDRLKKFITNFVRRRSVSDREPLRVTMSDINSIQTKGKWWLVGAAWAGHDGEGGGISETAIAAKIAAEKAVASVVDSAGTDLLKLAKLQKMNTDVRRSIFIVLMSSEDYIDAHERLMKLGLKDKQEREIVRVLLHCVGAEKVYNPYYGLVAGRLCDGNYGMKITFQFALWDSLREFEGQDDVEEGELVRRVSHFSKLYSGLVGGGQLGLTILKTLDFTSLTAFPSLFCQLLFTQLLTDSASSAKDANTFLKTIFSKLKSPGSSEELKEGILFFIEHYIMPVGKSGKPRMGVSLSGGSSGGYDDSVASLIKSRVKFVKGLLMEDMPDW
ncbi:suppressor of glycerol defect [Blyttiomyces sp. JEL0837]|nr:suppressor of glycerol defect [Blyttiomyces sp. JEL0837]